MSDQEKQPTEMQNQASSLVGRLQELRGAIPLLATNELALIRGGAAGDHRYQADHDYRQRERWVGDDRAGYAGGSGRRYGSHSQPHQCHQNVSRGDGEADHRCLRTGRRGTEFGDLW